MQKCVSRILGFFCAARNYHKELRMSAIYDGWWVGLTCTNTNGAWGQVVARLREATNKYLLPRMRWVEALCVQTIYPLAKANIKGLVSDL